MPHTPSIAAAGLGAAGLIAAAVALAGFGNVAGEASPELVGRAQAIAPDGASDEPRDRRSTPERFRMAARAADVELAMIALDDVLAEPRRRIAQMPANSLRERAMILNEHGLRALAIGHADSARRNFEAARTLMRAAPSPKAIALARLAANSAAARFAARDIAGAATECGAALRLARALLPEDHPFVRALERELAPMLDAERLRTARLNSRSIGADPSPNDGLETLASAAAPPPPVVIEIEVATNGPMSPSAIEPGAGPPPKPFALHLASMRSRPKARGAWRRLIEEHRDLLEGFEAHPPEPVDIAGRGRFYRVRGGAFADSERAEKLCEALRARGEYCAVSRL